MMQRGQNLIEKFQEILEPIKNDKNVRRMRRQWNQFKKTDRYRVAMAVTSTVRDILKENCKKALKRGKMYGLVGLSMLNTCVGATNSEKLNASNGKNNNIEINKIPIDNDIFMYGMRSEDDIRIMCEKLLSNDEIYEKLCDERSFQIGQDILNTAQEVQNDIKKKGRATVLRNRWGRNIPVGKHCIRCALELTSEAAIKNGATEYVSKFVGKFKNPNGFYGLDDAFKNHPNYKKTSRTVSMADLVKKETTAHPNDIVLIAHKSSGNHTGSGYHMVLYCNGNVISFNSEFIKKGKDAEAYLAANRNGYMINISKTVREDGRSDVVKNFADNMINAYQNNNTEDIKVFLNNCKNSKTLPEDIKKYARNELMNIKYIYETSNLIANNSERIKNIRSKLSKNVAPGDLLAQEIQKSSDATNMAIKQRRNSRARS